MINNEINFELSYDIPGIKKCQQNRYPLLFVDKIFEVVPGISAKGVKCFSYNEWFFPAHFWSLAPVALDFCRFRLLLWQWFLILLGKARIASKSQSLTNTLFFRFSTNR